jgi:HSP20 family protein
MSKFVTSYTPFDMFNNMDKILDGYLTRRMWPELDTTQASIRPKTTNRDRTLAPANVIETDGEWSVQVCIPGVKKENVEIKIEGGMLSISYKEESSSESSEARYLSREFFSHSFSRRWRMPQQVNSDEISAAYADGILTVTVPKIEQNIKKIEVK